MKAPRWQRGQGRGSIKAADLNTVAQMAEAAYNMTVGPGLLLDNSGSTRRLRLSPSFTAGRDATKRVAITATPQTGCTVLTVRAVKYAGTPPIGTDYAWDGGDFAAYPDVGNTPDQYNDLVWHPATDGVPTTETSILTAYRANSVWLVQLPTSGGGTSGTFPVQLELDYVNGPGGPGSASASASWIYVMKRPITGEVLLTNVSLDQAQHVSARLVPGRMLAANFGIAAIIPPYTTPSLIWCNERPQVGVCSG